VFAEQRLDPTALDDSAFASRKRPEHMRLRLIECPVCDLVYASPAPAPEALAGAYERASFDSGEESRYAARTYASELAALLPLLPDRRGAYDIGTGDGSFLAELLRLGFEDVGGIEPSTAPIEAAAPEIAPLIRQGTFEVGAREPGSCSLVTCFQTIEHLPDPAAVIDEAVALLKPGGVLAVVCHDRRAAVNRALGLRSPIVDVEHLQIFSPRSVEELLRRADLRQLGRRPIRNRYPIRYWARLSPLPDGPQRLLETALDRSGLASRALTLPVGNLLAWGSRG
jgi:SAM-dependent methyltransferase